MSVPILTIVAPWAMACMKSPLMPMLISVASGKICLSRCEVAAMAWKSAFILSESSVLVAMPITPFMRIARSLWAYLAATCRSSSGVKPVLLSSAATCTCSST